MIKDILCNASLADISSWADEVRNDPQYKYRRDLFNIGHHVTRGNYLQ